MAEPAETSQFNVRLELSEDGRRVLAVITPRPDAPAITPGDITTMLRANNWDQWFVLKDEFAKLPRVAREVKAETRLPIAEKRDAEITLQLAPDEMSARLTLVPARGGAPVTEHDLKVVFDRQRVTHGLISDAIAAALASQHADNVLVAEGTQPVSGEDTVFEALLPEISDRRPKEREDGSVDYRDISVFFTVKPDTPLMRLVKPTLGTAGTTVTGKVVPSKPGKDIPFSTGLGGTRLSESDRNVLVAAIGGQPVLVEHGVRVEPVINLENVDMNSGNIDFDGTVNVKGDVVAGLSVRTTGDICVTGMVEGATLEAGGNIKIVKGVIGRGELRTADGTPGANIARLKARGNIQARFIENALVEAEGDVLVDELLAHCDVSSQGAVVVGRPKAKKGHILGGSITAVKGVKAQVLGSTAGVRTRIEVGMSRAMRTAIDALRESLIKKCSERDKLVTLVSRAAQIPKEMLERARATLTKIQSEIESLNSERDALQQKLQQDNSARVMVGVTTHEGITIHLGESTLTIAKEYGPGSFCLNEKEIVYTP